MLFALGKTALIRINPKDIAFYYIDVK